MTCDAPTLGELISLRELSRRTSLSQKEVARLRDEEGLPFYVLGRRWQRVLVPEVMAWLADRRKIVKVTHPTS